MKKTQIILFFLYFYLIPNVFSISFFLYEGTEKCFHDDLPPEAEVHGSLKLIDQLIGVDPNDPTKGVKLSVIDPEGAHISDKVFQDKIKFMFTAQKLGKYQFCLTTTNEGHWIRENRKYRVEIKIHIGEDQVIMNKTARVSDLDGFKEGYRLLDNEVETFLLKQEIMSAKEEKLFHDNLESDSKVVLLTIIESFVLLALGIYQVLALRRFFIVKNLY